MAMNRSKHEAGVALTHDGTFSAGRPELDANTVARGRRVQQASERRSTWPGENGEVLGGNSACRFGSGPEFRGVARLCKQPAKGLFAKLSSDESPQLELGAFAVNAGCCCLRRRCG